MWRSLHAVQTSFEVIVAASHLFRLSAYQCPPEARQGRRECLHAIITFVTDWCRRWLNVTLQAGVPSAGNLSLDRHLFGANLRWHGICWSYLFQSTKITINHFYSLIFFSLSTSLSTVFGMKGMTVTYDSVSLLQRLKKEKGKADRLQRIRFFFFGVWFFIDAPENLGAKRRGGGG